jgi:hypothetical protein
VAADSQDFANSRIAIDRRSPARGAQPARGSRWYQRLSFKQALLTFSAAVLLGFVSSFVQLYNEWRHSLREVDQQVQRIPEGVNRGMTFVMDEKNEALRPVILDAIFSNPMIERVTLRDPTGG